MTKTKEEQIDRVLRVERLLRNFCADAMKSNGTSADVDTYVTQCREFVAKLATMEAAVWK